MRCGDWTSVGACKKIAWEKMEVSHQCVGGVVLIQSGFCDVVYNVVI